MKLGTSTSRRQALAAILSCLGLGSVPAVWASQRRNTRKSHQCIAIDLANMMSRGDGARIFGREYLMLRPGEADSAVLVRHIFAGNSNRLASFSRWPEVTQRVHMAQQCRDDFAAGRTVVVHQWVLAETEARLTALAALLL